MRNQPENGATLSKFVYNPNSTCYTIFQTKVKVTVFFVKICVLLISNEYQGQNFHIFPRVS